MAIKIHGKDWSCNNQCQSNCCSEIFLVLDEEQKQSYETKGYFIADNNYNDYNWLKLNKALKIKKLLGGNRQITIDKTYKSKLLYHPVIKKDILYIDNKCSKLLDNGRCGIYRIRPQACRKGRCFVFEDNAELNWIAMNGKLKEKRLLYEKGELKAT